MPGPKSLDLRDCVNYDQVKEDRLSYIENHSFAEDVNGCRQWGGGTNKGYSQISISFKKSDGSQTSHKTSAHKLLYMLSTDNKYIEPPDEISHLCGQKLCVSLGHLVKEDHATNINRKYCHEDQICWQEHNPPCIIFR